MNNNIETSIFLKKLSSLKIKNSDIWINEALFGFHHIKEYCKKLEGNNKVLEIGSGSGILLNLLSENFKDIIFYEENDSEICKLGLEYSPEQNLEFKNSKKFVKKQGIFEKFFNFFDK